MPRAKVAKPKMGPHDIDKLVGARIRARRKQCKKSQQELGTLCGVTFQQIQKYENGKNRVGASRLAQISNALECTPGFFFDGISNGSGRTMAPATDLADALNNREGQGLLLAFHHIKSKQVRQAIRDLVVSIGAA